MQEAGQAELFGEIDGLVDMRNLSVHGLAKD